MPQLVKGGKWVFGWVIAGPACEVRIPPAAHTEYGFQPGEPVVFVRGSRTSSGLGIARQEKLTGSRLALTDRLLGEGRIDKKEQVTFPPESGVQPGERLLVVRGSGLALGFVQRGPIYLEALKHPELETFVSA
jgi:hypothetical protein